MKIFKIAQQIAELSGLDTRSKEHSMKANGIILKYYNLQVGSIVKHEDYVKDKNFTITDINPDSTVNLYAQESGRMMNNANLWRYKFGKLIAGWTPVWEFTE